MELNFVLLHLFDGLQQILFQQAHDGGNLLQRALPVLRGKGVHCKVLQSDLLTIGGDAAESLCPRGVPRRTRQATALGPAAVSVHDDCHVAGQAVKIHLCLPALFRF